MHATNRVLTESYASFVDTCDRCETLLALDKIPEAIRVYLTAKQEEIMQQIRTNLNVNDSAASLSKEMSTLVKMIEKEVLLFK